MEEEEAFYISCFDVCCIHNVRAVQRQRGSFRSTCNVRKCRKVHAIPFGDCHNCRVQPSTSGIVISRDVDSLRSARCTVQFAVRLYR